MNTGIDKKESFDEKIQSFMEMQQVQYVVIMGEKNGNVNVSLYSKTYHSRALEFLYYLLRDSGLVKGNSEFAQGQITKVMLDMLMQNQNMTDQISYMMQRIQNYFSGCTVIKTQFYAKEKETEIRNYPRYVKKKNGWSYVKTLDIAKKGEHILVKSLENESGVDVIADEKVYIMIGKLGEVYDIKRDNFERTYQATEEAFDLFEVMPEYIPAAEIVNTGEYISLEDFAHVCYPRTDNAGIYAVPLMRRTKVFSSKRNDDYFCGEAGDYLAIRPDDLEDMYIIKQDVFVETYILNEC